MTLLAKLERKIGWLTISNLPLFIVTAQGMVYVWTIFNQQDLHLLAFKPNLFLSGEIWRILTFLFIVPIQNPLFAFFYLYLLYIYGTSLEAEWGSFNFTVFYLLGVLGTIGATFIGASVYGAFAAGAFYLNLTVFLAFAVIYPDFILHLFFIIPVKVKWLAWLMWIWLGFSFIAYPFPIKLVILASLINYFLFFTKQHIENIKGSLRLYQHRRRFKDWGQ